MLYRIAKRSFDVVIGGVLLILSLPIILLAAIAIRLETPGNPFFLQKRAGAKGKLFTIFKLRGMYADSRQRFPELYDYQRFGDLNFYFHHRYDPRVTRVGDFIRRTSIDELPNFLNVVMGTMSLVGPRPEVPEVLALYGDCTEEYVSITPGVTGLSKVYGRDSLTKGDMIKVELEYVRTRSFWLDFQIFCKTVSTVVFRRDVFGRHAEDALDFRSSTTEEGD